MRSAVRNSLVAMLLCWQLVACGASGTGASTAVPSPPPASSRPNATGPAASASATAPMPTTLLPVPTSTPFIPLTPTGAGGLAELTKIPLPGPAGRGGAILDDPTARQVYLGRAGAGLVAINTADETVARTMKAVPDPSGIADDGKFLYLTSAQDNRLVTISKADWSITAEVKTEGAAPGGVWADPSRNQLAVLGAGSHDVEVYASGPEPAWRATYHLPTSAAPRPGAGAFDSSRHVLYVAAGSTVFAVDLGAGQVRRLADLQPSTTAITGLIYDARTNDLWATTTGGQVAVLAAQSGRAIKTLPAPDHDQLAFDPNLRFMFTFGQGGFWAYDTNTIAPWARVDLAAPDGALGAVDLETDDVYVYVGGANAVTVFKWPAGGGGAGSALTTGTGATGSSGTVGGATGTGSAATPNAASGGTAASSGGGGAAGAGAGTSGSGAGGSSAVVARSSPTSIGTGGLAGLASPSPAAGQSAPGAAGIGGAGVSTPVPISTPIPISTPVPIATPVPVGGGSNGTLGPGQSGSSPGISPSPIGSGLTGPSVPTPVGGGGVSGGAFGSPGGAPTSPSLSAPTPIGGAGTGSGVNPSNPGGSSLTPVP
jgi:hypothetical protein